MHQASSWGGGQPARLLLFFVITYAVMWACFISVAVMPIPSPYRGFLVLLGAYSPSLAAALLTLRDQGGTGLRALLGRTVQSRVPALYFVIAAGYIVALKLLVAAVLRVTTGVWPRFGNDPWYVVLAAIIFSTPFQAGEELGWRGYALPRLAIRFGVPRASILLGLIWAFWHLPQFFIREADTFGQSFFLFVLQVVALSVALSWLWQRTRGSLLLPMLAHSAYNNSKDIVPSGVPGAMNPFALHASAVGWLTTAGLWILAAYFLRQMSRDRECGTSG